MGNIIRAVTVIGAVVAGAASATAPATPTCPPGQTCGPQPVPEFERNHSIKTEAAIDGIEVTGKQWGVTGWTLLVRNQTAASVSIFWDESSFVASSTESLGRLIRGETRKIDSGKAQPPTPLAPNSMITQIVIPEKTTESEELEAKLAESDARKYDMTKLGNMRRKRDGLIRGGKLYLIVEIAGSKQTWTGVVE